MRMYRKIFSVFITFYNKPKLMQLRLGEKRKRFKMFTNNNEGQSEIGSMLILPRVFVTNQKTENFVLDLIQLARNSRVIQKVH